MTRVLCLLVAVLTLATPAAAAPVAPRAAAEQSFRAGKQAYRAGKYLAAARAFDDAYEGAPHPAMTFSAAQAYRRQYLVDDNVAWLLRAKALYKRYLEEQPAGGRREHAVTHLYSIELLLARRGADLPEASTALPTQLLISCDAPAARVSLDGSAPEPAPLVATVTPGVHQVRVTAPGYRTRYARVLAVPHRLAVSAVELVELPGELFVVTSPGTEVWVDGARVGVTPLPPIDVAAGTRGVTLVRSGHEAVSRALRVERGTRTTLRVDLEQSSQRVAARWTLGGAGALALGSAVTGGLALLAERDANSERSELASGRVLSPQERDRYNSALERRDDFRAACVGFFGAALVSGGVGALLYVIDSPSSPPAPRAGALRAGRRSARR